MLFLLIYSHCYRWRIADEELFVKSEIKNNGSVGDLMEELSDVSTNLIN